MWDLVVDVRSSGVSLFLAARQRKIITGGRRPGRRYKQLGAALGFNPAPLPVAWTAPEDDAKAAALLGDGPVIALSPTANWNGKIWPTLGPDSKVRLLMTKRNIHPPNGLRNETIANLYCTSCGESSRWRLSIGSLPQLNSTRFVR